MALKDKWKSVGKGFGSAFTNLGKSFVTTAKVALDEESNVDENGNSKLKESWSKTGKGFGTLGKAIGVAAKGTVDEVFEEDKEKEETNPKEEPRVEPEPPEVLLIEEKKN